MKFELEDPDQPEIIQLLADGEAYGASLYPTESNHFLDLSALCASNVRFLVARDEGRALGIGAVVLNNDWAEIKRMWVVPQARGKGLSKAVVTRLEGLARESGAQVLRLETGIHNHEALALYQRAGFARCGPFANYREDPLSVFMEKRL